MFRYAPGLRKPLIDQPQRNRETTGRLQEEDADAKNSFRNPHLYQVGRVKHSQGMAGKLHPLRFRKLLVPLVDTLYSPNGHSGDYLDRKLPLHL